MTNSNCLKDLQCPACGNAARLRIEGTSMFTVTDDGTDDYENVEWDNESYTECPECRHSDTLKDFSTRARQTAHEKPPLVTKRLTSSPMFHTPGLFRALRNDYRFGGATRRRAVTILSDGYGISPEEARGLLGGSIPAYIDEAGGTVTYQVEAATPATR